ncbi:putative Hemerythrin-like metal-binding protein [Candidatus Terasakiella magnetica]|uniref:Putative Hemerythrin-like metal-binding protein n=1 Tax=Candidatus Terasakiella magnetica TaxID=1867952 RepID=A0A1C3RFR5_9PROT|nr:hemerythrin domain-containing protein [Candidatus Terasakiella magnetica]SCA56143.1 putative Hemerythrin-like metal-binding protein [Candidatus Terasakiella magnetica]
MIKFDDSFMLECEEIDKDHAWLNQLAEDISAAIDEDRAEDCAELARRFVSLCKKHFGAEESLLKRAGYPDAQHHHEHHQSLYGKMETIVKLGEAAATNELARKSLKKEVFYLLMDDIINEDLSFKEFVHKMSKAQAKA